MLGPAGKNIFQRSVLNILVKAGVCKLHQNISKQIPTRPTHPRPPPPTPLRSNLPPHKSRPPSQNNPQPYNPLRILRERLSSMREQNSSTINNPTASKKTSQPMKQSTRPSVIKPNNLNYEYSVSVSNHFSTLGN